MDMDMDRVRGQLTRNVLIGAGIGALVGLIIGLFIAWVVWPVEIVDTEVSTMRDDLQMDYLAMSIQSFAMTGNVQEAQVRWDNLGEEKNDYLAIMQATPPPGVTIDMVNQYAAAVNAGGAAPVPGVEVATATPVGGTTTGSQGALSGPWPAILGIMCLLTLAIGGLLVYLLLFKNRRPGIAGNRPGTPAAAPGRPVEAVTPMPEGQEPPIVQYLTTYSLGNDLYDDSFSIDSPSGEFLGECGVGISEIIGVGDPKKVTAFEVWLFDKNDIQTVTKVLMSQHAFNDPTISQRLTSKGEPVLAEPGKHILLETATLQLEARVVNMSYGQGALPTNSYFEQLTLELQVWPKA
jgi:hypothetical protein